MDKEFVEKINSIAEWEDIDEKSDRSVFSVSFSKNEDGLINISSSKGSFIYRLKPLNELFSPEGTENIEINWEDKDYMTLLYTIEKTILNVYKENPELTDSSVILALENLALKPEFNNNDIVVKAINHDLRLQLSMSDYSRSDVKKAIRKILNSAKRYNKFEGMRGYLNFILEHIP